MSTIITIIDDDDRDDKGQSKGTSGIPWGGIFESSISETEFLQLEFYFLWIHEL